MIDQIAQAMSELKVIEGNFDNLRKERNNLLFENEKLRQDLAKALATIQRLKAEVEEPPMSEFLLRDIRIAKEMPGFKSKDGTEGAQVLEFTLESADGTQKKAEIFTTPKTVLPSVGDKVEGEIEPQDNPNWAPKWVPAGSKKSSGFRGGKSPGETKAIQRQHSQEMGLRYATLIGLTTATLEQIHELTNWFEADISGKQPKGITIDPMKTDVPADMSGTPFEEGT